MTVMRAAGKALKLYPPVAQTADNRTVFDKAAKFATTREPQRGRSAREPYTRATMLVSPLAMVGGLVGVKRKVCSAAGTPARASLTAAVARGERETDLEVG